MCIWNVYILWYYICVYVHIICLLSWRTWVMSPDLPCDSIGRLLRRRDQIDKKQRVRSIICVYYMYICVCIEDKKQRIRSFVGVYYMYMYVCKQAKRQRVRSIALYIIYICVCIKTSNSESGQLFVSRKSVL